MYHLPCLVCAESVICRATLFREWWPRVLVRAPGVLFSCLQTSAPFIDDGAFALRPLTIFGYSFRSTI